MPSPRHPGVWQCGQRCFLAGDPLLISGQKNVLTSPGDPFLVSGQALLVGQVPVEARQIGKRLLAAEPPQ